MKKLSLALLALSLVSIAPKGVAAGSVGIKRAARADVVPQAKKLLQRLRLHAPKSRRPLQISDTPLLSFTASPSSAVQGGNLTIIAESLNAFTGRVLSVDYSVNGGAYVSAPLIGDTSLFGLYLGRQSFAGQNHLDASLYTENAQDHTDVRNAVKALDTQINRLTTLINAERNPAQRAILQEQRGEQIALKNELLTQLRAYRTYIGTQRYSYTVSPDTSSPTAPQVRAVSPASGDVRGNIQVLFTGVNFSSHVSAYFGGMASPQVTYVNSTSVIAYTPDFGSSTGAKDVELRFVKDGVTSNVLIPNGFYATNVAPVVPTKPTAIATGSQSMRLGDSATLDGSQSYDNRTANFRYLWKVVSAPLGSNFTAGQQAGTASSLTVSPSALGVYVFSLVVTEADTAEQLVSEPSIVQIVVGNAPQPLAPAIVLEVGTAGTSQVVANDPTFGSAEIYAISSPPAHGSATVNTEGLATYTPSANFIGHDSFTVLVTNQSGLSGSVSIPVTVASLNHAPVPSAPAIQSHTEPASAQIEPGVIDQGLALSYSIVVPPNHGSASVSGSGLVTFTPVFGYIGSDTLIAEVSTNQALPQHGLVNIAISVAANSAPSLSAPSIMTGDGVTGTAQVTVVDDAGQSGVFSVSTPPSHGSASVSSSGLVSYTSNPGYSGSDSISVTYSDNGNPALSASLSIPVALVSGPTASAPSIAVASGGFATSQITATSGSFSRTYTYQIVSAPAGGTASVSGTGLVTYTPTAPFVGSDSIGIKISDSEIPALSTTISIAAEVTENHAPSVSAPAISVTAGGTATSQAFVSDQDSGQLFTFTIQTPPSKGTATVSGSGLVTYHANENTGGADSVVIAAVDNGTPALSSSVSIPIMITGGAISVSAPAITVGVGASSISKISVTGSGAGAALSYSISTPPTNGTAIVTNYGVVFYTPSTSTVGASDSIGVTVGDNAGATASVTIPVSVIDANQAPVLPNVLFYRILTEGLPVQAGFSISTASTNQLTITSPNSTISTVAWYFGDGTYERLVDLSTAGIAHNFVEHGSYTAILVATDANGVKSAGKITANVLPTVTVPKAKIMITPTLNNGGALPVTYTFDASGSTDGNGITQYRWLFCGQGAETVTTTPSVTKTFTTARNCTVRLRVRNANSGEGVVNVTVSPGATTGYGSVPQFSVGPPREQPSGVPFTFDGSRSFNPNVGGSIASYNWDFGDPACLSCSATGLTSSYAYTEGSGFNRFVGLSIVSGGGYTFGPYYFEVFPLVASGTHIPHGVIYAPVSAGVAPFTVNVDASDSYAFGGASIWDYGWYFSDGVAESGPTATHTFSAPGTYTATLQINDTSGNAYYVSRSFTATATKEELREASRSDQPVDEVREYQRQVLTGSCVARNAAACAGLAAMYAEDGDAFTSSQYYAKACSLGYQPACSSAR